MEVMYATSGQTLPLGGTKDAYNIRYAIDRDAEMQRTSVDP